MPVIQEQQLNISRSVAAILSYQLKHKSSAIIPLRPAPDPSDHCLLQTQCWQGGTGLPWLMCIQNPMKSEKKFNCTLDKIVSSGISDSDWSGAVKHFCIKQNV